MKTTISILIATVITVNSFASVKPAPVPSKTYQIDYKTVINNSAYLHLSTAVAGTVSLTWNAGFESTTTFYRIEKRVNKGEFKTVAILMGEPLETYTFRDKLKDNTANVEYRLVMADNYSTVYSITQKVVFP